MTLRLNDLVINLLAGIDDPSVRMEVSKSIYYLYYVYIANPGQESEIKKDLIEICETVFSVKAPDLPAEKIREKAKEYANRLIAAFRLERMYSRVAMKF